MKTPIAQFSTPVCIWSIFLKFRVLNLDVNRWFGWMCLWFCQSPWMLLPFFVKGILRSALLQRICVSCLDIIWSFCDCRSELLYSFVEFPFWNQLCFSTNWKSGLLSRFMWTHYNQHSSCNTLQTMMGGSLDQMWSSCLPCHSSLGVISSRLVWGVCYSNIVQASSYSIMYAIL